MKDILSKLAVDFEYYTGAKYTGLVKAIGAGFASRLSEFSGKLKWIEKQAFIETADKDYLFLHGGCLVEPRGAEYAEGYVRFFGDSGAVVPIGVEIIGESSSYITIGEGIIKRFEFSGVAVVADGVATMPSNVKVPTGRAVINGVSKDVVSDSKGVSFSSSGLGNGQSVSLVFYMSDDMPVRCLDAGVVGNIEFGDVLKTKITISGLDREVSVVGVSGGLNEEGVEEYRLRVKDFLSNPQAPFNENNIKSVVLNAMPTVKNVWVKGGELEDGKVKVFAVNKSNALTQNESERVIELVKGIKPVQTRDEYIDAGVPIVKTKNVVIKGLKPSNEKMKEQVRKNIEYLFSADMFERGMAKSEIESMVYRTEVGGERVEEFTVQEGYFSASQYTLWQLGSVTFI